MKQPVWRLAVITLVVCCLTVVWWFAPRFGKVKITDLTTPQSYTVKALASHRTGIKIHVKGRIDGTAYVYVNYYEKKELSGDIDWGIYNDWFENECTIFYEPGTAVRGSLDISYTFD